MGSKATCLIPTAATRKLAQQLVGETDRTVLGLISLWQEKNNKDIESMPTAKELADFRAEVRDTLSAPTLKGRMSFTYGTNKRSDVKSENTFEAVKNGERVATTRYTSDGNIEYWSQAKVGDVIEFNNGKGEKISVVVTKPLTKLDSNTSAKEWSDKEGWSEEYFNSKVKPKIEKGEAYQMEYRYVDTSKKNQEKKTTKIAQPKTTSEDSFAVKGISRIDAQDQIDIDFDPRTRRDRVTLIARMFKFEVDKALEEERRTLENRIADSTDDLEKNELNYALEHLDRFRIIKTLTPGGIFNRILQNFKDYAFDTEENRVRAELDVINATKGSEKLSEEDKLKIAKKRAGVKVAAYEKVIRNFDALADEASVKIGRDEKIRFTGNNTVDGSTDLSNQEDINDGSYSEEAQDVMAKEESVKDNYSKNFQQISSHDHLAEEVRKFIASIPKLNYKGKYEKDDLGYQRYLDEDYVHAVLMDKLRFMVTSDDMIPLLRELAKQKKWVEQVIKALENDDTLYTKFYHDMRKDFSSYWIQKKKLQSDGSYKMETVALNRPEGTYYLLDSWRDNYENGTLLDDDSVYDNKGEIVKENAEKNLKLVNKLQNIFKGTNDTATNLKLLEDEENWNNIVKLLHAIGIDVNQDTLKIALTNIKSSENIKFIDPIINLLSNLNVIYSGITKNEIKTSTDEKGEEVRGDLINTFGSAYNNIALLLAEVSDDAIESSVRENDKSYYAHTAPNYLGKTIKRLKNASGNYQAFLDYIESEFGQYQWFRTKDGKWRNGWLALLAKKDENGNDAGFDYRKGLDHKVLLNFDKVEYSKWDDLDYTMVLLNEYFSVPGKDSKGNEWAWYHLPIFSDTPSAEFIKFIKYTTTTFAGEVTTYQEKILDEMTNLVLQEYWRIMLVRKRDALRKAGDKRVSPIASYDIKYDSKGNVTSWGGAEFNFLPALNNLQVINPVTGEKQLFIKALEKLSNNENVTADQIQSLIKSSLSTIMEQGFENDYKKWVERGLLEETTSDGTGRFKYVKFAGSLIKYYQVNEKALLDAKQKMGNAWTSEMESLLIKFKNREVVDDTTINRVFSEISQKTGIKFGFKNDAKEQLREYYWNSKFATSQIIQITTTDLAYYKGLIDFQKRYKEIHAPSLRLNTKAKFHGERVGKDFENTIYLKDDEIRSEMKEDLRQLLQNRVDRKILTPTDMDYILSQFDKVNVADAQAYRSLKSYRDVMVMTGEWTDAMETAYLNFKSGTWNMADFTTIWQTKKPFLYTQINKDSGVEEFGSIKMPVQHKNSEFLLLAMYEMVAGELGHSEKLKALNKFMEQNDIDVIQFESTTKVGKQGVIDINNLNSEKDILDTLYTATGDKSNFNKNVVHTVSYEDYGIQTQTPEHIIDTVQLIGTQIRKLITADISDDAIIDINGKKMTKKEWLDWYNKVNVENIIQSFEEIYEIFKDPKEIEKALLSEIKGNERYGKDLEKACTLDENGRFNLPLFDPIQSQRIQMLLNSIIKNRVTKQKIRGGALIQVSDYGMTDQLHIVWEGEGNNKRIKYFECYMPAYTKKFYEPLMKPGTQTLNLDAKNPDGSYVLPKELREAIGYRVPTEDKYSMVPLMIKGFLPQQNGSAIMLPAEITSLSGSDFDIDKLYIMLPEFNIKRNIDFGKAWRDFYNENPDIKEEITKNKKIGYEDYLETHPDETDFSFDDYVKFVRDQNVKDHQWSDTAEERFKRWFRQNRSRYTSTRFEKIKYDYNKSPKENGLKARNNAIIDLMWGVLTNPDTADKITNPGGFEKISGAASTITILNEISEKDLLEATEISNLEEAINKLFTYRQKKLDEIAEKYGKPLDPLSPETQIVLHQQNMAGNNLIGIYANHNASHAVIQHTQLALDAKRGGFKLNGKTLLSLHDIRNAEGSIISKNNANYLAASVDNGKDPRLGKINQNTFTADVGMLLSRLGYEPIEVAIFLSQPIIKDMTNRYFRESKNFVDKNTVMQEVIQEYQKKNGTMSGSTSVGGQEKYQEAEHSLLEMAKDIYYARQMANIRTAQQTSNYDLLHYYNRQVNIGYLFMRVMKDAEALGNLVQATKADTQNGAAGPTIADTMYKLQKIEDYNKSVETDKNFPFVRETAKIISDIYNLDNEDKLREALLNSESPIIQAFYTCGLYASQEMMRKYFPQYNANFKEVVDALKSLTTSGKLNVKTMNSVYNDLFAYIMSQIDIFGDEDTGRVDKKGNPIILTARQKRSDFINEFPAKFKEIITNNPDIAELEFIKRLKVVRPNRNNPVETLVFKNVGQLTSTLRERYTRDWETLLHKENPEAQKLAINLFKYSYYRNGFAFGPSSFMHLAPVAVRKAIPSYTEALYKILENEDDLTNFIKQYVYNHLNNRSLVHNISDKVKADFIGSDKEIADTVEIPLGKEYSSNRSVIQSFEPDGAPIPFAFITKKLKGEQIYYKFYALDEKGVATYKRVKPLGVANNFLEYEYDKDVDEIETVIKERPKTNVDNLKNADASALNEDPDIYNASDDYSNTDDEGGFDDGSFDGLDGYDVLNEAHQIVYNQPLDSDTDFEGGGARLERHKNPMDIEPSTEWKDEDGKKICGDIDGMTLAIF